jgi:hypothetical protein
MRIDDVITNYQRQGRSAQKRKTLKNRIKQGVHTTALLYDTVDLDDKILPSIKAPEWLIAYIKLLPVDFVIEKTERSFFQNESKVEILINLLLFKSL